MEFFRTNTNIPFMKQRMGAAIFSAFIFIASLLSIFHNGLNLGLDFTGGTLIEMQFEKMTNAADLRASLNKIGFEKAVVQAYSATEYSIRVAPSKAMSQSALKQKIHQALPSGRFESISYIGPSVGQELVSSGVLAVVVSFLCIMLYIAIRFEYRFAISAAIALIHDPILILGIFSYFHLEFNLIVLTALLTVLGYSLNDTIVVYDRVRENFRKMRKKSTVAIMDASINQTLSRTIMTSGLTLLVVIALIIFGGPSLDLFAIALAIGIVIGTYSSIYVAGSLAVSFGLSRENLLPNKKGFDDGLP